jgi:hypothetical protein
MIHERWPELLCPLPLRERATRTVHAKKWVRGTSSVRFVRPLTRLASLATLSRKGERVRSTSLYGLIAARASSTMSFGAV